MTAIRGTIRGNTIEVEEDLGLPDGQQVTVSVQPVLAPGEGIKRSAGTWADDPNGVDEFLEEMQRLRKLDRKEPDA